MVNKLLESILSFGYKAPKDPEKLLYDFYFMVGYVYGNEGKLLKEVSDEDGERKAFEFVLQEAINDCVNNLRKHMLKALKWSLSAEFRHVFTKTSSGSWKKDLSPESFEFLRLYNNKYSHISSDAYRDLNPGRKQAKIANDRVAAAPDIQDSRQHGGGRNATYMESYLAIVDTQKQLGYSDEKFAEVLFDIYSNLHWAGSFGGSNWAKIAKAYKKLLEANTVQSKLIYIDHAYDLQHNTGSVFTKVKAYYKAGEHSLNWLASALDWKRDAQKVTDYYDRVSISLKPLVGWISKKLGYTIEGSSTAPKEKMSFSSEPLGADRERDTPPSRELEENLANIGKAIVEIFSKSEELSLLTILEYAGYKWKSGTRPTGVSYYVKGEPLCIFVYPEDKNIAKTSTPISVLIEDSAYFENGYSFFENLSEYSKAIGSNKAPEAKEEISSRFKIGDKVKIKTGNEPTREIGYTREMKSFEGDIGTVISIISDAPIRYKLSIKNKDTGWVWLDEWLESVEDTQEFSVGDYVDVVRTGHVYSSYKRWANKHGFEIAVGDSNLDRSVLYKVIAVGPHLNFKNKALAGIKNLKTNQNYVIGIEGIEKKE